MCLCFCCILHLYVYQFYEFVVYFFNNYAKRTLRNFCIILSTILNTEWHICQFLLSGRIKYVRTDISILEFGNTVKLLSWLYF